MTKKMTSSRPYLVRAFHEWIIDNQLTPYVLVNATLPGVQVPAQFIKNGQIVLNISHEAVDDLVFSNDWIHFEAQFSGLNQQIRLPMISVQAIYAAENGRGMFFHEDDEDGDGAPAPQEPSASKPTLKVIK